jgi:hypothetical protein
MNVDPNIYLSRADELGLKAGSLGAALREAVSGASRIDILSGYYSIGYLADLLASGRVEDGGGSWGPMAITPFPISAHRTGGPDFRSPALRLASPQGTRRGSEWQAFEAQQTEFPIDSVVREPAGAAPCHFVPSCEEVAHALVGIAVNTAEC